jgi:hypothetical protein
MKHNKYKNLGIIFESLIHYTIGLIADGKTEESSKIMSLIKKNFLKKTSISECYNIYSQLLYSEAINYYHASKFYNRLIKEHNKLDHSKINAEISKMFDVLKKDFNIKEIMDTKVPNYKLFSSFRIATKQENTYLRPKNQMDVEVVILEHLVNNQELKKINNNNIVEVEYPKEKQEVDKLALAIAFKKFEKDAKNNLSEDQAECLIKYYSLSEENYLKWVNKKIENMLNELCDKRESIDSVKVKEKLSLYIERIEKIYKDKNINSDTIIEVMMGFDVCRYLKTI